MRKHGGFVTPDVELRDADVVRQNGRFKQLFPALRFLGDVKQRPAFHFVPPRARGGFRERLFVETLHLDFARIRDRDLDLRGPLVDENGFVHRNQVAVAVTHEVLDASPRGFEKLVQIHVRIKPSASGEKRQVVDGEQRPAFAPVILDEDVLLFLGNVGDVHVAVRVDDHVVHHHIVVRRRDAQDFQTSQRRELLALQVLFPLARQSAVVIKREGGVHPATRRFHSLFRAKEVIQLDRALERLPERNVQGDLQLVVVHQDDVETGFVNRAAAFGKRGINAHGVQKPAPGGVLVQTVQHSYFEPERYFVEPPDVQLVQTPFPHVSAHRRRVNVVLRRAVQTVPCEPKRQLKRLRGFRALHFHPGVRHQTHGFLVDSVAVVPRGTRHHFVIILVAHHVIHAVVDEHGDFVLRAVPNEVVDEPEVEFYFRGVSSRGG